MITIQSGKLSIPEDERFVGFAGDNTVITKQILILHRAVPGSSYTLCLRFDDGAVRSVPLSHEKIGSDVLLTWTVEREDMLSSGIVTAQVKMTDVSGSVMHTTKDYFLVGSSVELDDGGAEVEYITPSQLEKAAAEIKSMLPFTDKDGYWNVYDRGEEEFVRTDYRDKLRIDTAMSGTSSNPVANKTVTNFVNGIYSELKEEIGDIESALAEV